MNPLLLSLRHYRAAFNAAARALHSDRQSKDADADVEGGAKALADAKVRRCKLDPSLKAHPGFQKL